jgi:hypothetical protein
MSVIPVQFSCDSCGAIKRESNNWLGLILLPNRQSVHLRPIEGHFDDQHACGIPCALKLAAAFLEPILSQKTASGIPLDKS